MSFESIYKDFDYEIPKKQRTRSMKFVEKLFEEVDILLHLSNNIFYEATAGFPTFQKPAHRACGFFDPSSLHRSTHYSCLASFTGLPSISINIGYEEATGLPIGMQLISKWWREDLLLSVAHAIENLFPITKVPPDFQDIIGKK
ncbi:Fatty acid amide hydrolase [Thelohanellus kitauei]|uniref:Fatty acid amide hydrolase n=1 Tax=Thelohanellus kitauei TaxID=669202 RepID=A0A0C2M942_THEKT|nr:Fatty acid amide hydrolase [Thelohanellus kitauei]